MKMSGRSRRQTGGWYAQALGLVRPGAEAVLLAGVAIGCAQLAWRVVDTGGSAPLVDEASAEPLRVVQAVVTSPFAPFAEADTTTAQSAELAAIKLSGVRVSSRADRSGAVLTLADGRQRSFLVGYQIMDGVRLEAVASDHIVLAFEGGEQIVALDRPARSEAPVFALAMPPKAAPSAAVAWPGGQAAEAVSMNLPDAGASAASLLAGGVRLELRDGAPYGWRVLNVPPALAQGGLAAGDLVVSVNGASPADGASALAAAARTPLQIVVERSAGQRVSLQFVDGLP